MGGNRRQYERQISQRIDRGGEERRRQAAEFESELKTRGQPASEFVSRGLYSPEGFSGLVGESSYGRGRESYGDIAERGITGASYGRGREGYEEFSRTGGFSPGEREAFLRRSTAPTAAIYGRARDEMMRRLAIQGGYSPGFSSSMARATRQASQAGAEASLAGNVELANMVRAGRLEGLGGLERTREAAGEEYLAGVGGLERTREAAGSEALNRLELAQRGLSQSDVLRLQNRIQTGQLDSNDMAILQNLRNSSPSLFQNIMQGIGVVSGAAAPFTP